MRQWNETPTANLWRLTAYSRGHAQDKSGEFSSSHYKVYMSMESLNRKIPWLLYTPSTPFGGLGKGFVRGLASGESDDLSVTNARPWDLIASTSAGNIS